MNQVKKLIRVVAAVLLPVALWMPSTSVSASDIGKAATDKAGFTDIATQAGSGITYRRHKSPRDALLEKIKKKPRITFEEFFFSPTKARGAPGVALFDFDNDGDEDIYVTNGPGFANSLYVNQLKETGTVSFVDKALSAGVAATEQDSNGVCFGDIDNDGDLDLLVLGACEASKLFENNGDGTFTDISLKSGIGLGSHCSVTCSMGDVNGDGLLDIVIANNTTHWEGLSALYQHNQLLVNKGDNRFEDVSESSGLLNTYGPQFEGQKGINGQPTISWAIALVDYDLDGDLDIIQADDQTGDTSVEKGFIQIFQNDGTAHFKNVTAEAIGLKTGGWMGLSFGDINCDGHMDFFATNFGDYLGPAMNRGKLASRWFLGSANGTFQDPGVNPEAGASVFGWGTSMADFDNDGDYDIVYHGGEDFIFFIAATNPGVVLNNQGCSGKFLVDKSMRSSTDHLHRDVQGMAVGDLDNNGFPDVVSVSNFNIPESVPLVEPPAGNFGSPLDAAAIVQVLAPIMPPAPNPQDQEFAFAGYVFSDGTLSVELNNGESGNGWAKVKLLGTKGITEKGVVNRDGIGAVVFFTPKGGKTSMRPVVGGSSYASQDSLSGIFGLGRAHKGTVEILWPGGIRNRLYDVKEGEVLTLPEIPCSYAGDWRHASDYRQCVRKALRELGHEKVLSKDMQHRLYESAIRAYESKDKDPRPGDADHDHETSAWDD